MRTDCYHSAKRHYDSAPRSYYSDEVTQTLQSEFRNSLRAESPSATITVLVPVADAEVWFGDSPAAQRGTEQTFHIRVLTQGVAYTISVRWTENGRTMGLQRQIQVQPGQSITVNFQGN